MQKPSAAKECDIFLRARTTGSRSAKKTPPVNAAEANDMANVADVLKELKSLRSEFGSKLDGINNRLGDLANSISVLENNLGEVRHERLAYLEEKTVDLENRGRRKNIRLFGLKEGAEGKRPLLDFIHDMLPQWLDTGPDREFKLERAHRTLAPASLDRDRAVLIRFLSFQDREFVLRSTRHRDITHDGSKLGFAQDLSAETMRQRREFNGAKKLFVDMGNFRGFHLQPCKLRVLHNGKIHLFSSPQDAVDFHRKITAG
ncbi:hypothetical protein D5F01_LYC23694 [Larimichthys crocea]|uniref:LINE-1 type transposase domain-containing protein 1 n=1 Tax=Larimichthys crocea TaxID=215358 RepID=A0A6G0HGV7_LARCR|nr:hypothetical protein D5F01_LYC23694 [Larimichthys crocea]